MVDSLYQGKGVGSGGTHNAVLSSEDYLNTAARNLNNIEEGFYISPAFLDKLSIHVAKNFLDLPKIKVPLILGRPAFCTLQRPLCEALLPWKLFESQEAPTPCKVPSVACPEKEIPRRPVWKGYYLYTIHLLFSWLTSDQGTGLKITAIQRK